MIIIYLLGASLHSLSSSSSAFILSFDLSLYSTDVIIILLIARRLKLTVVIYRIASYLILYTFVLDSSLQLQVLYVKTRGFFSKRQRITLRLLYAIGRPSVVCLSVCLSSVTLVHPTQAVGLICDFFHHTIAQGLYFSGAKNRWWGMPLSP